MSKETNTFSIGDRVKTFTEVNSIPVGTTGTVVKELEFFDYRVKFDVPVIDVTDEVHETYAFYSHELEFIPEMTAERANLILADYSLIDAPEWNEAYLYHLKHILPQENAIPASARKLRGLTIKDLIAYYCQEMQITPEELIANFGNDEHNMNIMHQDTTNGRNSARVIIEDGYIVIEGA